MAKTDEAAYAAVEAELRRNPDSPQDVLLAKATEASPGIARLSPREFNARYPLQIKRKILRESGGGAPRKRPAGGKKRAAGAKRGAGKKRGGRKRRGAAAAVATSGGAAVVVRRRPGRPKGSGKKTTGRRRGRPPAVAVAAASSGGANREAVRQALLSFATEVVSAVDQPKNLIRVLAGVDKYVDRVVRG